MASTTSPNMNLVIPTVGQEAGPNYAFDLNADLTLVDQHDHSAGKGVQITPAGLNINASLSFHDNLATDLAGLVFTTQSSADTTINAISVAAGSGVSATDLYFTDGSGNTIQITKSGAVNVTASSIPGETYAGGTFIWTQDQSSLPTTPANFDIGSITLRPSIAATANGVTISPPSGISSSFDINLPTPVTAGSGLMPNFVTMDASGVMQDIYNLDNTTLNLTGNNLQIADLGVTTAKINNSAVTTAKIADGSVTNTKLAALNINSSTALSSFTAANNVPLEIGTQITITSITVATPGVINVGSTATLSVNQPFYFKPTASGTYPTGITAGAGYFVKTITSGTSFTFSATSGGAAINLTGSNTAASPAITLTGTFEVSLTTTGRPVVIAIQSSSGTQPATISALNSSINNSITVYLVRDGVAIQDTFVASNSTTALDVVPQSFSFIDPTVTAGAHVYTIQATGGGSSGSITILNIQLVGYEI